MKATRAFGIWKAIAFLTVIIFSISFSGCHPDEPAVLKPTIYISSIGDVTTSQAVIVASVVPNGEATVSVEYYTTLSPEQKVDSVISTKYNGKEAVSVIIPLSRLEPNALYNFTVTVINAAGSVTKTGAFSTGQLKKAVAVIKPATNVTRFEATLNATIVSNQDSTKVTFKYWTDAETTPKTKILSTLYNGSDSLNVSVDVTGLSLGTKIYYLVEVNNKAGLVVSNNTTFETCAVVDYDGNSYHIVTIGTQVWLRENLKTTHYANGDPIPNVTDPTAWANLTTGAYCQYNNDPKIAAVYGNLYNFWVGTDPRGLIIGWHTPTCHELGILGNYLGGGINTYKAGPMMMETGNAHWVNTDPYNPPTNSSGFTALPNGLFAQDEDTNKWVYMNLGEIATLWTSEIFGSIASIFDIENKNCFFNDGYLYPAKIGIGIRLLKN